MTARKIKALPSSILVAITLVIIFPITSIILAYLFHKDVVIDKPKVVEESIKSVVSIVISITAIFVSNALSRKDINRKISALRSQTNTRLTSLSTLKNEIFSIEFLDKHLLENSSAEVIRGNYKNEEKFRLQVQNLNVELEKIYQSIMSIDPEIGIGCSDIATLISICMMSVRTYLSQSSSASVDNVKSAINNLFLITKKEQSNQ
jgi:hypothetical protein